MSLYLAVMAWLGLALLVGTLAGLLTFIVSYRPFAPWKHGRSGAHLLWTFWALVALYAVSLMGVAIPEVPVWLAAAITNVILSGIFVVVWQRVRLYRDFVRGEPDED